MVEKKNGGEKKKKERKEKKSGVVKMGNGKRSGLRGSTEKSASLQRDVGLALKVQTSGSMPSKKMMAMSQQPPPHPHHFASDDDEGMGAGGDAGGGGPIYYNTSNRLPGMTDIYDVVGAGGAVVMPTTWHPFASDSSLKTSARAGGGGGGGGGGGMPVPVGVPFTISQWQELERQTMIYKYMMASMPVPPELLIAMARTPSDVPASQSNMSALDLRFSSGSDPEPWRCRRTDGKKWRCSRDVAPDQKYCERHAHKSRPRSRKPVELQPHTTTSTSTTDSGNTVRAHPLIRLPTNATTQAFQNPALNFPTLVPAATYGQPRCTEWLTKRDTNRVSILNQQWQQLMRSPSGVGLERNGTAFLGKNLSAFPLPYGEGKGPMNPNSYANVGDGQRLRTQKLNDQCCSLHREKFLFLPGDSDTGGNQATRYFIDAWSSAEREAMNEIGSGCSLSSNANVPLSPLTLSMRDGNRIDEENDNDDMGLGIPCSEKRSVGSSKSQWLNPDTCMGSPPGGPLGEALCLGITNTTRTTSSIPYPCGYSNSTTTGSGSNSS